MDRAYSAAASTRPRAQALNDDAFSARLRAGAAEVQESLVCGQCLADYIVETLETMRKHFRNDLALDDAATARETLRGVDCASLQLMEIVTRDHVKGSVLKKLPPATSAVAAGEDAACVAVVDAAFGKSSVV